MMNILKSETTVSIEGVKYLRRVWHIQNVRSKRETSTKTEWHSMGNAGPRAPELDSVVSQTLEELFSDAVPSGGLVL